MRKNLFFIIAFALLGLGGCTEPEPDGPTYGKITIAADETLWPVVDAEVKMFEHTYQQAKIEVQYVPENEAFKKLLSDSARLIIATRTLTEDEAAYFKKINITPHITKIAKDGIGLILHPNNPDSLLTCQHALAIFNGSINNWKQINAQNPNGTIHLVFDGSGSSTVSYVLKKSGKDTPPPNAYALKTTQAVFDYVAAHPEAIGICGYNWLSDYDDPLTKKLRKQAAVASVTSCENDTTGVHYKPFADNLYYSLYPFSREVFIISREARSGLGVGFASYVASDVGQRIILKAGLLPAYKVDHKIELKSEPFRVK